MPGAIPVGLCGTREEPIAAAEETLPRNLCPLIKSSYGFAVTDTCPYFFFSDLIVGETTCDGKKKMFELLNKIKPVHVMQLPYSKGDGAALELWIAEIRRLRERMEREFHTKIQDEEIWQAIELVERERRALKALCDLNKLDPPPLRGLELLSVLWSKSFSADMHEINRMLEELEAAYQERIEEGTLNVPAVPARPRVLLTGCPVGMGSEKVIRLMEELGGVVVAMENCTGYKTLELQVEKKYDDPVVALAHKYIQIPCSCMSPNEYRFELLGRMMEEFKVQAVVDLTWQACHTYNIEAAAVQRLVKARGVPYLHLESDYSSSDLGNLRVRLGALLEMV